MNLLRSLATKPVQAVLRSTNATRSLRKLPPRTQKFIKTAKEKLPTDKAKKAQVTSQCTLISGLALLFVFHPTCYLAAKFGIGEKPIAFIESYDYGRKSLGNARDTIQEQVTTMKEKGLLPDSLTAKFFEDVTIGLLLYFCLKPVRYPVWAKCAHMCYKRKMRQAASSEVKMAPKRFLSGRSRFMQNRVGSFTNKLRGRK